MLCPESSGVRLNAFQKFVSTVAAIGAVKRRGIAGLEGYGGKVEGQGKVKHKDGSVTDFQLDGGAAAKK